MFTQKLSYFIAALAALALAVVVTFSLLHRALGGFRVFWNG